MTDVPPPAPGADRHPALDLANTPLALTSGSLYAVEVGGTNPGTDYDQTKANSARTTAIRSGAGQDRAPGAARCG